uniref:Uncharacterized protein n=1 Tax=Tanacetum cinerariifolium TaxID=118510 RepID=A0A6L2JMP6_TANCI|nr:hypothetical protein [Tanacetum cinerariifolium]
MILLYKMQKSGSFLNHNKHLDLYNALMNSIGLDEAIKKGELDLAKVLKQKHDDDEEQDPLVDTEKRRKKDNITKANLVGLVYKLLKGTFRSSIEQEYNMEQCYLAMSDQLDWANLKCDICPYDLSKPLPLQGPPGHLTILVNFFFNNDLEYLETRNTEMKYSTSITKTKAARYELEGIEDMIPTQRSPFKVAYDRNAELGFYHCGPKH